MNIPARCIGVSADRRANVWSVDCVCGRTFTPPDTMLAHQSFSCPKCGTEYRANWNTPIVELAA